MQNDSCNAEAKDGMISVQFICIADLEKDRKGASTKRQHLYVRKPIGRKGDDDV